MVLDDSGIDTTFAKIKRSQELRNLLSLLQEEDPLFRYNVPSALEDIYDDTRLLAHLKEQYAKTEFYIRNATEIKQYARTHDKIIANKTISGRTVGLKNNSQGFVTWEFDNGTTLTIASFDEKGGSYNVFKKDVSVFGKKRSIRGNIYYNPSTYTFEKNADKELAKKNPISVDNWLRKLIDCYVIYKGKDADVNEWHVPNGTTGILAGLPNEKEKEKYSPQIIWMQSPNLKIPILRHEEGKKANGERFLYYLHNVPVTWEDIILVKQNSVSFDTLYQKHFSEERDKREVVTPIHAVE